MLSIFRLIKKIILSKRIIIYGLILFCSIESYCQPTPTRTRTPTPTPTRREILFVFDGMKSPNSAGILFKNSQNEHIALFGNDDSKESYFYGLVQFFPSNVSISNNIIDVTSTYGTIDGSTIDLINTINGGELGELIFLHGTNGKTITIHDGDGNIECGTDRILNSNTDIISLIFNGTKWVMLGFQDN